MQTQVIGRDTVEHDQEHVGRISRRQRLRGLMRALDPVSKKRHGRENQNERDQDRKTVSDKLPERSRLPLNDGNQTDRHSKHYCQERKAVNLRERDQCHRPEHKTAQAADDQPAASPGSNEHDEAANRSAHQEQAKIGQRNQPWKMPAHPVKMIGIECVLSYRQRPGLEQAGDNPAPGRKKEEPGDPEAVCHSIRSCGVSF